MNEERLRSVPVIMMVIVMAVTVAVMVVMIVENTDANEYEFLKAFASSHIDESDPDWECKKVVGLYELAKEHYPHFEKNTKWLADKKCGFDVSIITP